MTPAFLLLILGSWLCQKEGISIIWMKDISAADRPFVLATRYFLLAIFVVLAFMVRIAWLRRKGKGAKQ